MLKEELLGLVCNIETSYDVTSLTYKNVCIWPLLRSLIFFNKFNIVKSGVVLDKNLEGSRGLAETYLKPFFAYKIKDRKSEREVSEADCFFLVDAQMRNEVVGGLKFHKFGNSLQELVAERYKISLVETDVNAFAQIPRYGSSSFIGCDIYNYFLKNKILKKRKLEHIEGLNAFLENKYVSQHLNINEQILVRESERILEYRDFFIQYFSNKKLKVLFILVYYGKMAMGAILAARALGIKLVEIQHGQQGYNHLMYATWKNVPAAGYDLLPQYFWMWGKSSYDLVHSWAQHSTQHRVLLGGNPWLTYSSGMNQRPAVENAAWKDKKYRILVAAQYIHDLIEGPVPEAIAQSNPDDTIWLIRFHPRFKATAHEFMDLMKSKDCHNIIYDVANDSTLYDLYALVNYQITFWSTVAYEAITFGVNNIIVHKNGLEAMSEYIQAGIFAYTESATELLEMIESFEFQPEPDQPYMLSDRKRVLETLDDIMND